MPDFLTMMVRAPRAVDLLANSRQAAWAISVRNFERLVFASSAAQWIVVLSGRWWIESMDGTRIEQGPGEFSLDEDQGCTETDGKKGHRSDTAEGQPAVLMTVQLHVPPQRTPCYAT